MFQKKIINRAVVSVISAGALGATAAMTQAQMLEEVVVTATKKSESMQDVAISVQAMTASEPSAPASVGTLPLISVQALTASELSAPASVQTQSAQPVSG